MIIINQSRDEIINFDRVQNVWIDDSLDNDYKAFELYADGELLGFYKKQERAKEVLQEIIKVYGADIMTVPIYEMPED